MVTWSRTLRDLEKWRFDMFGSNRLLNGTWQTPCLGQYTSQTGMHHYQHINTQRFAAAYQHSSWGWLISSSAHANQTVKRCWSWVYSCKQCYRPGPLSFNIQLKHRWCSNFGIDSLLVNCWSENIHVDWLLKTYPGYDFHRSRSSDIIYHVTIRFAICHFLLVVLWNRASQPLSLTVTVLKISASKYIWITALTFWGHVTSSARDCSIPQVLFPIDASL